MKSDLFLDIAKLRTSVAYLGEKDQCNWWSSSFLSRSGDAFLTPVFPKTNLLARVNGASSAAQLMHDEHIGVGEVFHLFRLPENVEHNISQSLSKDASIIERFKSVEDAYTSLQDLAGGESTQGLGPLLLNQSEFDKTTVRQMAAAYLAGFKSSQTVYPYYRGKT